MAIFKNTPPIVNSGLVLYMDAANPRSMPGLPANNLLRYSEQFDQSPWVLSNATITANAVNAPNGTLTADKLISDTTATAHHILQAFTTSSYGNSTNLTYRGYIKAAGYNYVYIRCSNAEGANDTIINLTNGNIESFSAGATYLNVTSLGDGWYQFILIRPANTGVNTPFILFRPLPTNVNSTTYTGDGTSGIYLWGAQVSTYPSVIPYVQTTATAITGSTPTWTDISGNNGSGSLTNVGYDSDKRCLLFTSASQSTCVLNNSSLLNFNTGSFSIEVVVKITSPAIGTVNSLYIKRPQTGGIGGSKGFVYRILANTGTTAAALTSVDNGTGVNNGDYVGVSGLSSSFPYFTTIHSVLVFNAGVLNLSEYRNGVLISSTNASTMTGSFYNNSSNLTLGKFDGNSLDAEYYIFRAYNKVLSASEVKQNYDALKTRFNLS